MHSFKIAFVAAALIAVSAAATAPPNIGHDDEAQFSQVEIASVAATAPPNIGHDDEAQFSQVEVASVAAPPSKAPAIVLGHRPEAPHSVFVTDDKASPFFRVAALPVRIDPD